MSAGISASADWCRQPSWNTSAASNLQPIPPATCFQRQNILVSLTMQAFSTNAMLRCAYTPRFKSQLGKRTVLLKASGPAAWIFTSILFCKYDMMEWNAEVCAVKFTRQLTSIVCCIWPITAVKRNSTIKIYNNKDIWNWMRLAAETVWRGGVAQW